MKIVLRELTDSALEKLWSIADVEYAELGCTRILTNKTVEIVMDIRYNIIHTV